MSFLDQLCDDVLRHALSFLALDDVYAIGNVSHRFRELSGKDSRFRDLGLLRLIEASQQQHLDVSSLWEWESFSGALRSIGVVLAPPLQPLPDSPDSSARESWWTTVVIRKAIRRLRPFKRGYPPKVGWFYGIPREEHCRRHFERCGYYTGLLIVPMLSMVLFAIAVVLAIVLLAISPTGTVLIELLSAGLLVSLIVILLALFVSFGLFLVQETWSCSPPVRQLREKYEMLRFVPSNVVHLPISSVLGEVEVERNNSTLARRLTETETRHGEGNHYEDLLIANILGASLPVYQAAYLTAMVLPSSLFVAFLAMLPFANSRVYALIGAGILFVVAVIGLLIHLIVQCCQHGARTLLYYTGFRRRYWQVVAHGVYWWTLFLSLSIAGAFVDLRTTPSYVIGGILTLGSAAMVIVCVVSCVFSYLSLASAPERFEFLPDAKRGKLHIGCYAGRDSQRGWGGPQRDPVTFCGGEEEDGAGQVYVLYGLWCLQLLLCLVPLCASLYFLVGHFVWIGLSFFFPMLLVSLCAVCCLFVCMCTRALYDTNGGVRVF